MNILITGAGGAAAVSVWKSLHRQHTLYMADMDPCAAGLYLVPPEQRLIIPPAKSEKFTSYLFEACQQRGIDVLIPTVDDELVPLAQEKSIFSQAGIRLPLSSLSSLTLCRDKYDLLMHCKHKAFVSRFTLLTEKTKLSGNDLPYIAKPRKGSGSRDIFLIKDLHSLAQLPKDGSYLLQEYLPGEEYSVDVYIHSSGVPLAAVPRLRLKIDSGVAVAACTKINPLLSEMAIEIAKTIDLTLVANIQFKADKQGLFKLLEVNPRFPGTLPLTNAAGVDVPQLLINDILGYPIEHALLPFKELMVVRYWDEEFIDINEWETLCQTKPY